MKTFFSKIILSVLFILPMEIYAASEISLAEIEARIAALDNLSTKSASGHFVVVGTNRVENFALARWCEDASTRMKSITGMKVPFNNRRIILIVGRENSAESGKAYVRYAAPSDRRCIARVYLKDYDAAYECKGRQATCCAIISAYSGSAPETMLSMPEWLWQGIEQNLLFDVRSRNMKIVLSDWRSGKLMTLNSIISAGNFTEPGNKDKKTSRQYNKLDAYSVFVRFLSSQSHKKKIFVTLFNSKKRVNLEDMSRLVLEPESKITLDEEWERWLMKQSKVVRSAVLVSTRVIEQMQSEMLLYPGACGIPLASEIPRGAPMEMLVRYRKAEWLPQFVNSKRGRINLIAAGHKGEMAQVAAMFDEYLAGLETEKSDILLLKQIGAACAALSTLAEKVKQAGGIIYK
jgi:hypothetical protein